MASKWDNFLANLGEWRGSFTTITAAGLLQQPSPSVLTLARGEGDGHGRFTLQRWSPGTQVAPGGGPGDPGGPRDPCSKNHCRFTFADGTTERACYFCRFLS